MFDPRGDEITARVRRLRTIWLALMFGVALWFLVVWVVVKRRLFQGPDVNPVMLGTLSIGVAMLLLLAPVLRRRLERHPRTAGPDVIAQRWQLGWIVGQALKEAVGLFGLVLALLAGALTWALAFALISIVSMAMTPPWDHELRLRIHRAEEARGGHLGR
jgi:hypothetical protein